MRQQPIRIITLYFPAIGRRDYENLGTSKKCNNLKIAYKEKKWKAI